MNENSTLQQYLPSHATHPRLPAKGMLHVSLAHWHHLNVPPAHVLVVVLESIVQVFLALQHHDGIAQQPAVGTQENVDALLAAFDVAVREELRHLVLGGIVGQAPGPDSEVSTGVHLVLALSLRLLGGKG